MSRSAIFVIDIQHEMAGDPSTSVPDVDALKSATTKILSTARAIIDGSRAKGAQSPLTLVFVQHEEPAGSGGLERDSKQWELVFPPRENDSEEVLVAKTHGTPIFWHTLLPLSSLTIRQYV